MIDLDAIKARAEAATPGPWEADASEIYGPGRVWLAESCRLHDDLSYDPQSDRDAAFIAHARTDVPELVAGVESLGRQLWGHLHVVCTNDSACDSCRVAFDLLTSLGLRERMKEWADG